MTLRLVDAGTVLSLGSEIARGGEGAIYAVSAQSQSLAKIYLRPPTPEKAAKVTLMRSLANSGLTKVAAWPTDLVQKNGKLCGFLMPRVASSTDAHMLYSPKSRATSFPQVDFRFIVHAAANMARAFATIHGEGHVIGDINHGHVLVGQDGRVSLIDADSFQISANGHTYTCDVGSPLFTAPELQERSFRGLLRTVNHDLFGLAVLIFHMLFMGRHPYSGVWQGRGEMPIERAIKENRFAYGHQAERLQMKRPPGTLPLGVFGGNIANLFEAAFGSGSTRPSAIEWAKTLDILAASLVRCAKAPSHHYPKGLGQCPWCQIEQQGVRLFGAKVEGFVGPINVAELWRAAQSVSRPSEDPAIPSQQHWDEPLDADLPSAWRKPLMQMVSVLVGLAGVVIAANGNGGWFLIGGVIAAFFAWPRVPEAERSAANAALAAARRDWDFLLEKWQREASVMAFDQQKSQIASAKAVIDGLPADRQKRMDRLKAEHFNHQKSKYLDRFRIDRAKITGIGQGRSATLASFGIETALDISQRAIGQVPGFGPTLTGALMDWRHQKEAQFRYNPSEPIDPTEISRVENEIAALGRAAVETMHAGVGKLRSLVIEVPAARQRLMPSMVKAWNEYKIAETRSARL